MTQFRRALRSSSRPSARLPSPDLYPGRPLRVLIVDDSPEDAEALLGELQRGGYQPAARRVATSAQMEGALAEAEWDIILADFETQRFSALLALSLLRELDLDTPFVIISGAIGEEAAVRAIKAGAHNCIQKTALGRLSPTVERELREAQIRRERRQGQKALRESETRFRTLAETASDAILMVDQESGILFANAAAEKTFGHPVTAVIGSPLTELIPGFSRYLESQIIGPDGKLRNRGRPREPIELPGIHASGRELPLELSLGDFVRDGKQLFTVIVRDVSERKLAEQQVAHLAFHDALTQLPNRLLFNDRLAVAAARAQRLREGMAILYLDLDRFRTINDSLGHSVGDRLLCKVAERLARCVREGDTLARLGGDEFVLLISGIGSSEDAARVARRVLNKVRLPFRVEERELFVTTSLGASVYPADGQDAETLLRNADTAMYRAKDLGRDNFQLYTSAMSSKAMEQLSLEGQLRQALSNDQLTLYYQPIVDLKSGRIRCVEALLRWQHPERGLLLPEEFIPLAEISGLIVPIGRWALRTACAQARQWQLRHGPSLAAAVNLSARQFQQAELVANVRDILQETGLPPGSLELEITESNAMQHVELTLSSLTQLRHLGVRISLDDFGIGYSSLSYLKRLPIDRIKIDQSFVRDVTTDPDDAEIARAIIAMAHTLKLTVIAEGVETEDQLAFLAEHRCDQMQGALFSPAVPAGELEGLLEKGLEGEHAPRSGASPAP